jgi:hypothetical protein
MTANELSAAELLDVHVGQEVPGGCMDCDAVQRMREDDGIYVLNIQHSDGCPTLAAHRQAPARQRLAALREQWLWWRDADPERIAEVDVELDLTEAGGDRLLAIRAWRAARMAELEVLGTALAERIENDQAVRSA